MSRDLTVRNNTYVYPDAGENPGWGEDATEWAQAVTDSLNDLQGPNDIPATSVIIADNVIIPSDVPGLRFIGTAVRSFEAEYNIFRSDGTNNSVESGRIYGYYDGTNWQISQQFLGDASVTLSINNLGQVQYTSSSIGGLYVGIMKFRAKTIAI